MRARIGFKVPTGTKGPGMNGEALFRRSSRTCRCGNRSRSYPCESCRAVQHGFEYCWRIHQAQARNGAAGEALGYDRHLKSNTSKQRTHPLFRQGAMLYDLIPMMPEPRLRPLVERFGAMLLELPAFAGVYGAI